MDAPLGLLPRSPRPRSGIQTQAVHMPRVYIPLSCRIDPCWARNGVPSVRNGAAKNWRESASPPLLRSPQAPPSHSPSIPCRMLCTGRLCTFCRRRKRSKGVGVGQNRGTKEPAAIAPPAPRPAYLGFPLDLVDAVYTEGTHIGQSHGRSKNQGKIVRAGSNLERKEMAATRPRWRRICAICRNTCPACGDSSA